MDINIGDNERVIRLIISIFILTFGLVLGKIWLLLIGLILLTTAITGKCLLYKLLKVSTKNHSAKDNAKA